MFDFDAWHQALANALEPWQAAVLHVYSLNDPHEDKKQLECNRPRRQRMVEDLLVQAMRHGVCVTKFRDPLLLPWYNKLFHFHKETGAQLAFFTDNSQVPAVGPDQLYDSLVQERNQHRLSVTQTLDNQPTLATTRLRCFSSLLGTSSYFSRDSGSEPDQKMQSDQLYHGWITMPRPFVEQSAVLLSTCICSEEERNSATHQIGDQILQCNSVKGSTDGAVLVHFLEPVCHRFWAPSYSSRRDIYNFSEWALVTTFVLPHGAENTMRSLLDWLRARPPMDKLPALLEAIRLILWDFHPLVLPYFIRSDTFIEYGLCIMAEHYKGMIDLEVLAQFNPGDIQHLTNSVGSILGILTCIVSAGSTTQSAIFHKVFAQELLFSYHAIYEVAAVILVQRSSRYRLPDTQPDLDLLDAHIKKTLSGVTDLGGYLYQSILSRPSPDPGLLSQCTNQAFLQSPGCMSHSIDSPPRKSAATWTRFLKAISYLQNCKRCCSSRCTKTLCNDTLWKCAGCKRVQYCSRRCQKQAWIEAGHPHRVICSSVSLLCQRLNIPGEGITADSQPQLDAAKIIQNAKEMNILSDHFDHLFAAQYEKLVPRSEEEWRNAILTERDAAQSRGNTT